MIDCRHRVVAGIVLATLVVVGSRPAFALNPRRDVVQYAHTTWRNSDGFATGRISAIAQTQDGYLWLGTDTGLLRFDGVKALPWQPANQRLPSNRIRSLAVARDGTLWISTDRGVVSWKDERLTQYAVPFGEYGAGKIVEDRDGVVWAAIYLPRSDQRSLCSFRSGRAECYGQDGGPGRDAISLYEDRKGQLWVGTIAGLWRWKPAPARFYPLEPQIDGFQGLDEDQDGALLIARRGRVDRFVGGRIEMLSPFPPALAQLQFLTLFRDRDGGLWFGGSSAGLLHMHQGITDVFGQIDGLSSDIVGPVFEDREGNIWVGTAEGLDRFRDVAVATVSTRQGLSNPRVNAVLASPDGSVWISTSDGLNRTSGDQVTVYRDRAAPAGQQDQSRSSRKVRYITGGGLPIAGVHSIFQDDRGRVWLATESGIGCLEHDRVVTVAGIPGGLTRSIAEDAVGAIWIANQERGLFRISQGRVDGAAIPWSFFGHQEPASAVVGDPLKGGVWVGFGQGGLNYFADGRVQASYGADDGLGAGRVSALHFDRDGTLWIATGGGLSRLKSGRVATLNSGNGLPCDAVQWVLEDSDRSFWLATPCGLVRISAADMDAWAAAADERQTANQRVQVTVFGSADGFRTWSSSNFYTAPAVKSSDGRLWFVAAVGVGVFDPRRLPSNSLTPPVHIEQLTADRKTYNAGSIGTASPRLPALTREVQIDYTALSLVAPEKTQFRYKLEGHDSDWQDAGTRRQAFYTDLSPGDYRFRVMASNNDGVWNEAGATLNFVVAPAYYQTTWFLALATATVIAAVWGAHRVRLRIVEKHEREISALNERLMKAQEQERIRIAGELHDGVMQNVTAVTMLLGVAKLRIPDNSEAKATIDKIQHILIQTGTDIRQLSHDLHPPLLQDAGLPKAVHAYCEQFSTASGIPVVCEADERVGDLSRGSALALFRIVQEALGNAAKHAAAKHLVVRLNRSDSVVSLTVTDDGIGFDRTRLSGRSGLGLVMMRERASQLNGTFELESAHERGTTIRVVIPFR